MCQRNHYFDQLRRRDSERQSLYDSLYHSLPLTISTLVSGPDPVNPVRLHTLEVRFFETFGHLLLVHFRLSGATDETAVT